MSAYNEIVEQIVANPENTSMRLKFAERLSGDGNSMGEIIRLQCELDELTEQDAGWYWRSFKLANLLRGANPFLAAFGGETNESVWTSELHAIKHDGKSVGHGKIERGLVETYAVFDLVRMKACEQAVMSAAPLIRNFEFSELRTSEQFDVLASLDAISHATRLTFSKCYFPTGELERILNLKQCRSVVGLAFAECTFADGADTLLRTNVAEKVQQLVITINREQAEEFGRERSYLGSLFTSRNLPSLLSLELDQCCFTEDLTRGLTWIAMPSPAIRSLPY